VRTAPEERMTKERTSDVSLSALWPGRRTDEFPKGLMEINTTFPDCLRLMWILTSLYSRVIHWFLGASRH
jgi:hypothetical protein